ncbi:MAG: ribonuclease P protein component 4 [Thermoplasmata archaeon]
MPAASTVRRGGRRGRRTGSMVRIAGERIADLFALAEREAVASHGDLAHRYVVLARKVGMRYNVRLLREYRELYCRTCSVFWVEGRTVRTRLRSGRRVRTCLACGRERRTPVRPSHERSARAPLEGLGAATRHEGPPLEVVPEATDDEAGDGEGEEE